MGQPIVHFEVLGKDGEKSQAFYGGMFGWEFQNPPEQTEDLYGLVDREQNLGANGEGIGGGVGSHPRGTHHLTFYVEVPSVEEALVKAEELGGERVMGPAEPLEGLVLGLFTDPDGNLVGVVEPAP